MTIPVPIKLAYTPTPEHLLFPHLPNGTKAPTHAVLQAFNSFYIDTDWNNLPDNTHYTVYPQPTRGGDAKGSALIFLPDQYETGSDRFPVLYWLHGGLSTQRQAIDAIKYYHKAQQDGLMPATIIVSVQGLPVGWYADSKDGSRKIATIVSNDLVDFVDSHYRTLAMREARWIEGFSMGGYGTLHLGFKYPELYGALSMIAGAILPDMSLEPPERVYDTFFADDEYWNANHPTTLLSKNGDQLRGRTLVRLLSGSDDTRLITAITNLDKLMDELDMPHQSIEVKNAAHEYMDILHGAAEYGWEFWAEAASRIPK